MVFFLTGLVRAICMKQKAFYILTPLPPDQLAEINCLVKGTVDIMDLIVTEVQCIGYN